MRRRVLFSALLGLCACSRADSADTLVSVEAVASQPASGGFVEAIAQLHGSPLLEACDQQMEEQILELGQALDRARTTIETDMMRPSRDSAGAAESLGPLALAARSHGVATGVPGAFTEGWGDLYSKYIAIKDEPVAGSYVWQRLYMGAASMLNNDAQRLSGSNMELDRNATQMIANIDVALTLCNSDAACVLPPFDDAALAFIETRNWIYFRLYNALQASTDPATQRSLLHAFQKRVGHDLRRFAFAHNALVRRDGDAFVVPIDAEALGEGKAGLQEVIDEVWQSDTRRVRLEFVRREAVPQVFRVVAEDQAGRRDYVAFDPVREMHLYQLTTRRAVAHEMGHVLGFPDHYDTVWHAESCGYVSNYDDADVMSLHETGKVTDAEWEELEQAYPGAQSAGLHPQDNLAPPPRSGLAAWAH